MGKNQGAKKGTVVHLAHLVANDKAHIPDRPQERAPDCLIYTSDAADE